MKKVLSIILAAMLVLTMSAAAFAIPASAAWSGAKAASFAAGSGTEADPYLISSAEELAYLAYATNNENSSTLEYYKLTADIDISGTNWEPIGSYAVTTAVFRGVFDGDGHTVSGLSCESSNAYGGLFGRMDGATVKNLNVRGTLVSSTNYAGGIIAYGVNSVKIINCTSAVDTVKGSAVGGIVGRIQGKGPSLEDNLIVGCISSSNVESTEGQKNAFVGGIVGAIGATTVSYCGNTGNISVPYGATTLACAGGVVGIQGADNSTSHIFNSYNTGNISAVSTVEATYAGGIVGRAAHIQDFIYYSVVKNCFTTGSVVTKDINGVVLDGKYGSLIGHIRYIAVVENCYTSVPLTQYSEVGTDDYLSSIEDGDITVLTVDQMKGILAVETMKLGPAWVGNASGIPTFDIEKVLTVYTEDVATTEPEETTVTPVDTMPPVTDEVTTDPGMDTTKETEVTEAPDIAVTTKAPAGTEPADSPDGGGVNIFVIIIIVVAVVAVAAIVVVIVTEKKKQD